MAKKEKSEVIGQTATKSRIDFNYLPKQDSFSIVVDNERFYELDSKFQIKKSDSIKSVFGIIEHTAAITPSYNIETSGVFGVSHKSGEYAVSYYDFETAKLREIINLDGEFLSFVGDKERNRILIYSHGNPTNIYMYDVGINPKSLFKIETSDRDWYQKMELSPNGKFILIDCKQKGNKENS